MLTPLQVMEASREFMLRFPKTEAELRDVFVKLKKVFDEEQRNYEEMWTIYGEASKGEASQNEIDLANKKAIELVRAANLTFLLFIPGAVFALPVLVEMGRKVGVELIPQSVKRQFNL